MDKRANEQVAKLVCYEMKMFEWILDSMRHHRHATLPEKNLRLEGLLLHARTLMDFLISSGTNSRDILAKHFLEDEDAWIAKSKPLFTQLREDRGRINKKLAHLSYRRLDLKQGWDDALIAAEVRDGWHEFVASLDPTRRSWFKLGPDH
jgi:hypothetical protein